MTNLTQKQLAEMAGVSIVTIFNALYHPEKVKDETRKRIFDLMAEHDYSPDAVARSMVRQKTNMVGVLIPSFEIRYYACLVSAIEKRLNELGYRALISQHLDDPQKEASEIRLMREYRVDGIMLRNCGLESDRDQIVKLAKAKIPFVLMDGMTEGFDKKYIGDDDFGGACDLVQTLIGGGRKRIACIGFHRSGDLRNSNRYKGYCEALTKNHIPVEPDLVENCLNEYTSGDFAIEKIMCRTRNHPIDAVFAFNDGTALKIIKKLQEMGYHPQQEIQVAGFGGYYDKIGLPFPLLTVKQDTDALGKFAVAKLMNEINHTGIPEEMIRIKGSVITI